MKKPAHFLDGQEDKRAGAGTKLGLFGQERSASEGTTKSVGGKAWEKERGPLMVLEQKNTESQNRVSKEGGICREEKVLLSGGGENAHSWGYRSELRNVQSKRVEVVRHRRDEGTSSTRSLMGKIQESDRGILDQFRIRAIRAHRGQP